jgi:hypothetical protein
VLALGGRRGHELAEVHLAVTAGAALGDLEILLHVLDDQVVAPEAGQLVGVRVLGIGHFVDLAVFQFDAQQVVLVVRHDAAAFGDGQPGGEVARLALLDDGDVADDAGQVVLAAHEDGQVLVQVGELLLADFQHRFLPPDVLQQVDQRVVGTGIDVVVVGHLRGGDQGRRHEQRPGQGPEAQAAGFHGRNFMIGRELAHAHEHPDEHRHWYG